MMIIWGRFIYTYILYGMLPVYHDVYCCAGSKCFRHLVGLINVSAGTIYSCIIKWSLVFVIPIYGNKAIHVFA